MKEIAIENQQSHIEYLIPINTISRTEDQYLDSIEFDNGIKLSIEEFDDKFKGQLLNTTVYKNGTPYYVSNPRVEKYLRDALTAHHVIRFYYYPNSKINQNVKTYEYRRLIERLILVIFGSCPQIVFDRPKNYKLDTWGRFIRHSRFLNRRFVELKESRVKLFFEIAEICFDSYPNKKINAVLELFEQSQLYGASTGLRNSMLVTILESFFVTERNDVGRKFANRLSDNFRTKKYDFQYFNELYAARSEFYHHGICKFDELKEYELIELTQKLIFEHIIKINKDYM